MKITKVDIAQALGMIYTGEEYVDDKGYFHVFEFLGKHGQVYCSKDLDEAWEEAAEKLLEPLVELLLGNLDDE